MDIGLVTAFLGGFLALLSPCGALLLPAFFASTVGSGPRLLLHGAVFYLGLLIVLVPLGIGAGALGSIFATHRALVIGISSALLVVLGILQIFGIGFDPAKIVPGSRTIQQRATTSVGLTKSLLLGAASGVAGFCAGPILGAVLTLAAAQGNLLMAGVLLAVYGAGMVVPLILIAALWHRLGTRGKRVLRGSSFTLWGREFHTTSVITGLLIIIIGIVFWLTNGLLTLPELLPHDVSAWLQSKSAIFANIWVDIAVILVLAAVALLLWWRNDRKKSTISNDAVGVSTEATD